MPEQQQELSAYTNPDTLGLRAVEAENARVATSLNVSEELHRLGLNNMDELGWQEYGQRRQITKKRDGHAFRASWGLNEAREFLKQTAEESSHDADKMSDYLYRHLPPFLLSQAQEWEARQAEPADVLDWLLASGEGPEEQAQIDAQFMNFLQAHNAQIQARNSSPEFRQQVDSYKQDYAKDLKSLTAIGVIDQDDLPAKLRDLQEVSIEAGDIFSLALNGRVGYYNMSEKRAVIPEGEVPQATVVHELNHAVLGEISDSVNPKFYTWLNEAMTEHLAQVIVNGREMEAMAPTDGGSYSAERMLLAEFVDYLQTWKGVDTTIKDLAKVYTKNDPEALEEFQQRLSESLRDVPHLSFRPISNLTHSVEEQTEKYMSQNAKSSTMEARRYACMHVLKMILEWPQKEIESARKKAYNEAYKEVV